MHTDSSYLFVPVVNCVGLCLYAFFVEAIYRNIRAGGGE